MKKIYILFLIIWIAFIEVLPIKAQWQLMSNGNGMDTAHVYSLGAIGSNICAGTVYYGISYTTNNGVTWQQSSLNNRWINSFAVNGNNIYAAAVNYNSGVYVSTNNGVNWSSSSLNTGSFSTLASNGNNIFAAISDYGGSGLYISTNNGVNWTHNSLNQHIGAFAFHGNYTFAGDSYGGFGVFSSTNNGASWIQTSLNLPAISSLSASGNNILAGSSNTDMYISTNDGISWTAQNLTTTGVKCISVSGNSVFAGIGVHGFYVSNNNGANWTQRNEGLNDSTNITAMCVSGNYVYIATYLTGIYRRSLSDVIGIKQISEQVPENFMLLQNYPNPFNPETKIKFELPKEGLVKLVIYDALGREVETLINEKLQAGIYETQWNAAKYPSGVYFYKLESGNFAQTKKMVLIK